MVWCVFNPVRHRVQLSVLHDHLHPECCLCLSKQTILHPLKQHQRLLDGSVSPGRLGNIVSLQFLHFLVTHVSMAPGRKRETIPHALQLWFVVTKSTVIMLKLTSE